MHYRLGDDWSEEIFPKIGQMQVYSSVSSVADFAVNVQFAFALSVVSVRIVQCTCDLCSAQVLFIACGLKFA